MNISNLGFNKIKNNINSSQSDFQLARVITVQKESYIIHDGTCELFAKITGKIMFSAQTPLDYPTVGDWVYFQKFDDDSTALIHDIVERSSVLKRKTSGKKVDYQVIASNIDSAFVVQAIEKDFNIRRLERYLSMIYNADIEPVLLLSKTDLVDEEVLKSKIEEVKNIYNELKIIPFSNVESDDYQKVKESLIKEQTYCLIGSSGVGKTSLLNNLIGKEQYSTAEIREHDGKGRHSTTVRNLIMLENGAMLIDTPGMRELGNISNTDGIEKTFDEISELTKLCKFNNCTHTTENGCAVLKALETEAITEDRYKSFMKLNKEAAYHERSYLEKRQQDKEFSKFVKSVLKGKHPKR
ncbi:MAG: ribosome small subunit-dependent GTPase A [Melioribacteraceae bacterium]|nr:ribosome small subunit-dependent GTPase A [Melioribacteraceae bacterium]